MARSKQEQSAHDRTVERLARKLERQGFDVQADAEGFPKPRTFGGLRPDIVAEKGAQRKIIEVETPKSEDSARDEDQKRAFRQVADRSENTTFRRVITKK